MAGPYKTLFQALQASAFITGAGITLAFGEECIADESQAVPYVVMVPRGGPAQEPGYAIDGSVSAATPPLPSQYLDVNVEDLWEFGEVFQFFCWAFDPAKTPIDNTEAAAAVRLALLAALRDQRAMVNSNGDVFYGLSWKALRSDWQPAGNMVNRFGRAFILTVQIDIPAVMAPPTSSEVTVETTQFNPSINNQPG
jgi:hypothetical protein